MIQIIQSVILTAATFLSSLVPQPIFIEGVVGQPGSLDPSVKSSSDIDESIKSLVFSGLLRYDSDGRLIGDLADSWEISENKKEYKVLLKNSNRGHNGQKITSADVVYSYQRIDAFTGITLTATDDYTITFSLENPYSPFLTLLTTPVVPQGFYENPQKPFIPNGTGPFRVVAVNRSKQIDEIELLSTERLPYKIKRIAFKFYPNREELQEALKLGEIQAYGGQQVLNWSNYNYTTLPIQGRVYGLFFNLTKESVSDKDFRRNLAKSVNRDEIIEEIYGGEAKIVNSPLDGTWAQSSDVSVYDYVDTPTTTYNKHLTITVPANLNQIRSAEMIRDYWAQLGVTVDIVPVSPSDMIENVIKPKNYEVLLYGLELPYDPDLYSYWHSTQLNYPGLNFTSYGQMRVDKALEEGRKTDDLEQRKSHYANFLRVMTSEVPTIFLYQPDYTYTVSKKISGVKMGFFYYPQDRFLNLADWEFE